MDRVRRIMRNSRALFGLPNVIGMGCGCKMCGGKRSGEKALVVFVTEKLPENKLPRQGIIPQAIDDIPTDVIAIGKVRLLNANRTGVVRPLMPGISIGHPEITAGTLGAIVYDNRSGEPLLLSNNHVLANVSDGRDGRCKIGDPIYQPGAYDGGSKQNIVGTLERFVPVVRSRQPVSCPVAQRAQKLFNQFLSFAVPDYQISFSKLQAIGNRVDAAVAKPVPNVELNPEILGIGRVVGKTAAAVGMRVKKSGRTTGITTGEVIAVDGVLQVNVSETETAIFEDQIILSNMSKGGDSGSLIVNEDNAAIGLLFAGSDLSTIANRIENVEAALDVHL